MRPKYITEKFRKLWAQMDVYIHPPLHPVKKIFLMLDFLVAIPVYGLGINDYLQYEFYKKRHADRKNFIVYRKRMRIVRLFNRPEDKAVFDSKQRFNAVFNDYIGRHWLDIRQAGLEEFIGFSETVKRFMVKPAEGSHGKGIRIMESHELSDMNVVYEELHQQNAILEEVIQQHEALSAFNPTSVNTLRVVTLVCADGTPRVITANLRMGRGERHADNFHHHGIAALLDTETGIVVSKGIDRDFQRYVLHPHTGKQIVGFQVPRWKDVVDTVKAAALVMPTVGYVGWDVAVGKDGRIFIIEGNAAADPDISQMPDQVGKWPLYSTYVKEKQAQDGH